MGKDCRHGSARCHTLRMLLLSLARDTQSTNARMCTGMPLIYSYLPSILKSIFYLISLYAPEILEKFKSLF